MRFRVLQQYTEQLDNVNVESTERQRDSRFRVREIYGDRELANGAIENNIERKTNNCECAF